MSGEGFLMTSKMAMVFFRYIRRYNVPQDEKARLEIVRRLVAKKKAEYIRDPKAFIEGKKALIIRRKPDDTRN